MPSKVSARGGGRRAPACRECGARAEDGAIISARDLCVDCGIIRNASQKVDLQRGQGQHYDQWIQGMADFLRSVTST